MDGGEKMALKSYKLASALPTAVKGAYLLLSKRVENNMM